MDENLNEKTPDDTHERSARTSSGTAPFGLPAPRTRPTPANETSASTALVVVPPMSSMAGPELVRLDEIAAAVRSGETKLLDQAQEVWTDLVDYLTWLACEDPMALIARVRRAGLTVLADVLEKALAP